MDKRHINRCYIDAIGSIYIRIIVKYKPKANFKFLLSSF